MATLKKTISPNDGTEPKGDGNQQPRMILLVGLPCTGKSTYIANNIDPNEFEILSVDSHIDAEVARRRTNGEEATYRSIWDEYHPTAKRLFKESLMKALEDKKNIIIDKTNLTLATRAEYIALALENDYRVEAVIFETPEESLYNHLLRKRGERTGKIIYPEVILERQQSFCMPSEDEGISRIEHVNLFSDQAKIAQEASTSSNSNQVNNENDVYTTPRPAQKSSYFAALTHQKPLPAKEKEVDGTLKANEDTEHDTADRIRSRTPGRR